MKLHVCCSIRTLVVLASALIFSGAAGQAEVVASMVPRQQVVSGSQLKNSTALPSASQVTTQVKSYREWKQSKITEAEGRVKNIKETLQRTKGASSSGSTTTTTEAGISASLQGMLDKEEMQFSLAQDLTISDYFVGYLTKQKSLGQAIKEVSGRLSAEEVAELMMAYADNFFNSKSPLATQSPKADSGL